MRFVDGLRSGAWLTPERLRRYPALIGSALALAVVALVATSHGALDAFGHPLGADFSGIWVAGREVIAGLPARPFDHAAHAAAQASVFGVSDGFLPWPYPPYFLAVAAALARLPYLAAVGIWQAATLAVYLATVAMAARGCGLRCRDWLLPALAFPAVAINALHGQNGFLTAGLIGVGTLLLPTRPLAAGAILGLIAYKPQFALLLPVALVAGWHWRAIAAAAATVLVMTGATIWAYGIEPWRAFVSGLPWTRIVILERGGLESWKLESAFAAMRLVGASVAQAYALQALVTLSAAATLAWIWSRPLDTRLKLAALASATLLATPYCVDYDFAILGPALVALVAFGLTKGFAPYEKSVLAVTWIVPLLARPTAMALHVPLGFLCVALLHLTIVARAAKHEGRVGATRCRGSVDVAGSS